MPIPFGLGNAWYAAAHGTPVAPSDVVREVFPTVATHEAPGRGLGVPVGDGNLPLDANGCGSLVPFVLVQPAWHFQTLAPETDGSRPTVPRAAVAAIVGQGAVYAEHFRCTLES
jgi:hypothetical protein